MASLKTRLDALELRRETGSVYAMTDQELLEAAGLPGDATNAELLDLGRGEHKEQVRGNEPLPPHCGPEKSAPSAKRRPEGMTSEEFVGFVMGRAGRAFAELPEEVARKDFRAWWPGGGRCSLAAGR